MCHEFDAYWWQAERAAETQPEKKPKENAVTEAVTKPANPEPARKTVEKKEKETVPAE